MTLRPPCQGRPLGWGARPSRVAWPVRGCLASWPCSHIRRGTHHGSADMLRAAEPTGAAAAMTAVYSFRGPASARAATVTWSRDPGFLHPRGVSATCAGHVQVNSLYAYGGSLTTPGCTEDVRWPVPADGAGVSNASLTRCHKVIARSPTTNGHRDNNRPLQHLNGRVMKLHRSSRRQRQQGLPGGAGVR